MHEQARYSSGSGWIWALIGLIVLILLLFGAVRSGVFAGERNDDPIFQACTDTYGRNNCSCFAGILKVQLSERAYQSYVRDLQRDEYRLRYFDGRLAENSFIGRDAGVCVDASDICKVPVCEPRFALPQGNIGIDGTLLQQSPEQIYDGGSETWDQGS